MPGSSAFEITPSTISGTPPGSNDSGWYRAIPSSGLTGAPAGTPPPPAPTGMPTCASLESSAPPTLLNAYDIYNITIPWGAAFYTSGTPGDVQAEIAILINGQVRWLGTDTEVAQPLGYGTPAGYGATGTITADLVNAIRLGPRERLSLRMGVQLDPPVTLYLATIYGYVGAQISGSSVVGVEGTISYTIVDLPGVRQL